MTGCGPPPKEVDELAHKVYSLIPNQFDSLANVYDSDAAFAIEVAANKDVEDNLWFSSHTDTHLRNRNLALATLITILYRYIIQIWNRGHNL